MDGNSSDPQQVALAYSLAGEIAPSLFKSGPRSSFLRRKWTRALEYRLIKEL